jgi:TorA maturation chaperone TorD
MGEWLLEQPLGELVQGIAEEDALRARFYGLLAHLLAGPPGSETLENLRRLEGDDTEMGRALGDLASAAAAIAPEQAEVEFNALFIGLTEGELIPYGSYYLTGFLYEKPLADLRGDLDSLGIARSEGVSEPEDHIASLCEVMHGLIVGAFGVPADVKAQRKFFDVHVNSWAPRFFTDLEVAEQAVLYRPIGTVGRTFMAIEREAFSMVD